MGEVSSIQWTQRTWNPWQGCAKVSAGCDHCYMFRDKARYGQDPEAVVRSKPATFQAPMRWEREAAAAGRVDLVFTCSWSDWFIREADPWRADAWAIVRATPHLTYQILTKRPARIAQCLPPDWGDGYPNVWLGVSVEDRQTAGNRVPALLQAPARLRFLSVEPMLASPDLRCVSFPSSNRGFMDALTGATEHAGTRALRGSPQRLPRADWIIFGGESGPFARPLDLELLRLNLRWCREERVPAFVKQLGSHWAHFSGARDRHGGDMAEWPADLRVREFPE